MVQSLPMLKVKLARFGKNKQPHYRIVVNEAKDKRDGRYVALLGHYAPNQTPKVLTFDLEAYREWLKKGAQPTDTVAALAKKFESGNPFPPKKAQLSKKAKAKLAAEREAVAAPKEEAAPAPEAVAEEVAIPEEAAPQAAVEATDAAAE